MVATTLETFKIVNLIKSKPVAYPLGVQYFGAAPFLFGEDRAMKFSAMPGGGEQPQIVPDDASENYLKDALVKRMAEPQPVYFDFMIQVRDSGESELGIENATTDWDENKFKYVTVATITITTPQLDIDSQEGEAACEKLVFTPWHSLATHQPIGSINRLRKEVYDASSKHRK